MIRILVADDHPIMRIRLKQFFSETDDMAVTGGEASLIYKPPILISRILACASSK